MLPVITCNMKSWYINMVLCIRNFGISEFPITSWKLEQVLCELLHRLGHPAVLPRQGRYSIGSVQPADTIDSHGVATMMRSITQGRAWMRVSVHQRKVGPRVFPPPTNTSFLSNVAAATSTRSYSTTKLSSEGGEKSDRLHSTDIAFKPNEDGWGYTKRYSSNYERIFGKRKEAQNLQTEVNDAGEEEERKK